MRTLRFFQLCLIALAVAAWILAPQRASMAQLSAGLESDVELDPAASRALLKSDLRFLKDDIDIRVREVVRLLDDATLDKKKEETAQKWADYVKRKAEKIFQNEDPIAVLLDVWAMSARMIHYLTDGEGGNLFGPQQSIVLEGVFDVHEQILDIAAAYLTDETFQEVSQSIEQYVAENPLKFKRGQLFAFEETLFSLLGVGKSAISTVVRLPLVPGRAAKTIGQGGRDIHRLTNTAEEFAQTMQNLPAQTRREMEILLTRIADSQTTLSLMIDDLRSLMETTSATVKDVDELTSSVQRTLRVADETSQSFARAAESIDRAAQSSDRLVQNVSALTDRLQGTPGAEGGGADFDIRAYTQAAQAIESGALEVRAMLQEIRNLIPEDGGDEDDEDDFDVREYEAAARSIREAAAEIRALLSDVETLTGAAAEKGEFERRLAPLLDETQQRAHGVIDRLAIRVAQLLGLAFVLALAYAWIRPRLARRGRE